MNTIEFIQTAYERTDQDRPFDEVYGDFEVVTEKVLQEFDPYRQHYIQAAARSEFWTHADDSTRTLTVIQAASGLRYHQRHFDLLHNFSAGELLDISQSTDTRSLAINGLVAVADTYKNARTNQTVPSDFVPWLTTFSREATDEQLPSINDRLTAVSFSDHHVDSGEDMEDPHPVSRYLFQQPSLAISLQETLIAAAVVDTKTTDYKPHVWQSQLNITLHRLAIDGEHPLRTVARQELGAPLGDDEYTSYLNKQRQAETDARLTEEQRRIAANADATLEREIQERRITDGARNLIRSTLASLRAA